MAFLFEIFEIISLVVLMTYANLEVISPQPVRDEMKRRIEQLLSRYR